MPFEFDERAGTRPRLENHGSLDVQGLAVARGGRLVVRDVSLRVKPGEAVQVTGPNGAGKSSLLRALAGLLRPERGHVTWSEPEGNGDATPPDETLPLPERVHYVGHADGLKSPLTARQNLEATAALAGTPTSSAQTALERLGLGHLVDVPVGYLSAGQRRRVALARLLTAWRPLWLLDEPATALDVAAQAQLAELLQEHRAAGGLVIAATHAPFGLSDARELRLEP